MKIYLLGKKTIVMAIITSVISGLIFFLRQHNINVTDETIWKWYYEIQKIFGKYFPNDSDLKREIIDQLNRKLIEDEKLREYKVRRDVDYALIEYENWEKKHEKINMKDENILKQIDSNKYNELQKRILKDAIYYEFKDGTMGIRGEWVPADPREIDLK